jgi:hypothetical protein
MAAPEILRSLFVKRCYELANDTAVVFVNHHGRQHGNFIGGLLTSTFITLVFVPTVYTLFEEGWAGLWKKHPHQQAAAH